MVAQARCRLDAAPASVREGRRFARALLQRWGLQQLDHAVTLLVSETVTNAIIHARSPVELAIVASENDLRVEVRDNSPVAPVLSDGGSGDLGPSGRGMVLVDALADRWGCDRVDGGGKVVWFELEVGSDS